MQMRINSFTNHSTSKTNYNKTLGQEQNIKRKQSNFGAISMEIFKQSCNDVQKFQPELLQMSERLEYNLKVLLTSFMDSVHSAVNNELKRQTINAEQANYLNNFDDIPHLKLDKANKYRFVEFEEQPPENGNLSIKNWKIFKFVGEGNKCIQIKFAETTEKFNHRLQGKIEKYYIFDIEITENNKSIKLSDFFKNALTKLSSDKLKEIAAHGTDAIGVNGDGVPGFLIDADLSNRLIPQYFDLLLGTINEKLPNSIKSNAHLKEALKEMKANWQL